MERDNQNRGLRNTGRVVLVFMIVIFFFFFVATAASFAVIAGTGVAREQNLFVLALETYLFDGTVDARRGTITDRSGKPIAAQHPSYTMYANFHPDWGSVVEDIEETAEKLAEVLDVDEDELFLNLSREGALRTEFGVAGQRLSFIQKNEIESLGLSGIYFDDTLTRFYPNGIFASHTIGYTKFGGDGELIGAMGLEDYFNDILTGTDGDYQFLGDRYGMPQPNQERMYINEPKDGYDIRLTIDETIQIFLETAFDETLEEADDTLDNMVGVVMDVRTGEILAAASRPTFDPNTRELEDYMNAIMYPFEPGSTIKVVTYAATINEGNYHGNQIFSSGSRALPGDITIWDHQRHWGDITFDEGFLRSSNTAIVDMFRQWLRSDRWIEYLDDFGFGAPVGLPLSGELSGVIPEITDSPVDLFMSGYGQGRITVTPIQQLQALTAILNEGELIRPQLISEIFDPNTNTVTQSFEREVIGQPITAATARQVQDLMIDVVADPAGTGYNLYDLDVASGGKTGTAQLFDPETRLYHTHLHIYSYIGFAPAENPEIMMFIAVQRPRESLQPTRTGHTYAAQAYQFVMNNTLRYLGLGPATPHSDSVLATTKRMDVPNVLNLTVEEATLAIETAGLTPIIIGDHDRVFRQSPSGNATIVVGDKVFIQTDIEDELPNFNGWTRAQIVTYASMLDLEIEFRGQGFATRQTTRAGRSVGAGDTMTVTLE